MLGIISIGVLDGGVGDVSNGGVGVGVAAMPSNMFLGYARFQSYFSSVSGRHVSLAPASA